MSQKTINGNKMIILALILENKSILFGALSDKITKKDKYECWKSIHEKACSLGLVSPEKDWTYTRDVVWQNIKKSTVKKIDNRRKTGSEGGENCKLTEIDCKVLEIIGKESPIITSLNVPETWEPSHNKNDSDQNDHQIIIQESTEIQNELNSNLNNRKKKRSSESKEEELFELKKKKVLLQIELLEKENYRANLEILKLEKSLGLSHSKFTQNLFQ